MSLLSYLLWFGHPGFYVLGVPLTAHRCVVPLQVLCDFLLKFGDQVELDSPMEVVSEPQDKHAPVTKDRLAHHVEVDVGLLILVVLVDDVFLEPFRKLLQESLVIILRLFLFLFYILWRESRKRATSLL